MRKRLGIALIAGAMLVATAAPVQASGHAAEKAKAKSCKHAKKGKKRCRKRKDVSAPPTVPASAPPDLTAPAPPTLSSTTPLSPGSGTHPRVVGSAEAGSTVTVYDDAACSSVTGTGTAVQLASTGITVTASANSTNNFYATAVDAAGNVSGCSADPLAYVEAPVEVDATPALTPSFAPGISDYTVPCDGSNPVSLSVDAPHGSYVNVDGAGAASGSFTHPVSLQSGQEFDFKVTAADYSGTYHVRCLPSGFPTFTYERFQQPNNPFYLVDPDINFGSPLTNWVVLFDDNGVPVWWAKPSVAPIDSKVLSDGMIAWANWDNTGYAIHNLDGSVVKTVHAVGGGTDPHDLQQLPNGDFLVFGNALRNADLTAYGGPANGQVLDAVIQEIDPSGQLVWQWNSGDHIGLDETGRWWPQLLAGYPPYDVAHINGVEVDGNDLLVSFRHFDAVYKIDRSDGHVIWKLGGTHTSESLSVVNDPRASDPGGPLMGQHDPRLQTDGTVTVHDNGSGSNGTTARTPRAVRYAIDEQAKTATLVESVSDPNITSSVCCGSARRSPSGSWLMSWGGNPVVEEFAADGSRDFRMTFANGRFSYRAFPVPSGLLTAAALRAGMDAQYPRP
jgi:hypothetical protein